MSNIDLDSLFKNVISLIQKADVELDPSDSMKFSQAALNAAHAISLIIQLKNHKQ